ncbi:MAG: hypothetical protein E7029_07110 [Planctomycetaceae bacterium]|nr:hypothetical protein [Planctomycetaceae bacterium]
MSTEFVVIMGQRGYGKTTILNRLLGTGWTTAAATTGTLLPHIKIYQDISDEDEKKSTYEETWVPYVKSRHDSSQLDDQLDGLILRQQISQEISWYPESELFSERKLTKGIKNLIFVDLMGIGESLVLNQPYYEIYREFVKKATHVLWITDASRRGYLEDQCCLREIKDSMSNIKRFTILLNKADSIGLRKNENPNPVPTEYQKKLLKDKLSVVTQSFHEIAPHLSITEKDVIPFSAYYGWNFEALSQLFFE